MKNDEKKLHADIATAHGFFLQAVVCWVIAWFIPPIHLIATPVLLWSIYKLGKALGYQWGNTAGLILLQFIPIVNLIALYAVDQHATRVLRDAGFRVGFLGVSRDDVHEYLAMQ